MGIILSIIGNYFEHCQKHNRYKVDHNRPGLILQASGLNRLPPSLQVPTLIERKREMERERWMDEWMDGEAGCE